MDNEIKVEIRNYKYDPQELTIPRNTEVEFSNFDQDAHSVTSSADGFDLELDPKQAEKILFNETGIYDYYCRYHPEMVGTIVVEEIEE